MTKDKARDVEDALMGRRRCPGRWRRHYHKSQILFFKCVGGFIKSNLRLRSVHPSGDRSTGRVHLLMLSPPDFRVIMEVRVRIVDRRGRIRLRGGNCDLEPSWEQIAQCGRPDQLASLLKGSLQTMSSQLYNSMGFRKFKSYCWIEAM